MLAQGGRSAPTRHPPPPDVFTALSSQLHAYAVVLPRPNIEDFDPLHIVELKQTDDRKDRPTPLHLSVLRISERILHARHSTHPLLPTTPQTLFDSCRLAISNFVLSFYSPETDASNEAWTQLQKDLGENVSPREDARQTLSSQGTRRNAIRVSTNSLRNFRSLFGSPESITATGASSVSEQAFKSTIELKDVSETNYTGQNLDLFLASHARLLYEAMLMYQLPQRAVVERGDRSLLAIVTTQFTGTLIVSVESRDERKGFASLWSPISRFAGRQRSRRNLEVSELVGVLGLRFVVIPIERIDEFKWRFYPSFPVSGPEIDESVELLGQHDHLFRARNWAEGKEGASLLNEDGYEDIDIAECASEFAHVQCLLAMQLRDYIGPYKEDDSSQNHRLEISAQMLRSSAELGNQLAITELAVNYRRSLGVEKNIGHAEELESAARQGSELPDPPPQTESYPSELSIPDYRLTGVTSTAELPERGQVASTASEWNESPEVLMRIRQTDPSGALGRNRSIWVERCEGIMGEDAWWLSEEPQLPIKGLEPVGRLRRLSVDDKTAVHMSTIVREGDQVEITLQGYHAHARKRSGAVPALAPRTEVLRVYSLTRETYDDFDGFGLRQRAVHVDDAWTDDSKGHYFTVGYWQSSIFEDYVSQDTNGITIQIAAEELGAAEKLKEEPFRFVDCSRFDPFSAVVETSVRGRQTRSSHPNEKRLKKHVFMPERQWLFAKTEEDVRRWDSPKYLRYGYYFVLERPTEAQLFSVVSDSHPKLYLRDTTKGTFIALEEFDYYVMRVSFCARMPRPWMQSKAKRAALLRKVCNQARHMDSRTLKEEIVSIMEGRPRPKTSERSREAAYDEEFRKRLLGRHSDDIAIGRGDSKKTYGEPAEQRERRRQIARDDDPGILDRVYLHPRPPEEISTEERESKQKQSKRRGQASQERDDPFPEVGDILESWTGSRSSKRGRERPAGERKARQRGEDFFDDSTGYGEIIFEGQYM